MNLSYLSNELDNGSKPSQNGVYTAYAAALRHAFALALDISFYCVKPRGLRLCNGF
jgi:hypothetical protein